MSSNIHPYIASLLNTIISDITIPFPSIKTSPTISNPLAHIERLESQGKRTHIDSTPIHVLKCYKQVNPDLCGFHCVFNMLEFVRSFSNDTNISTEKLVNAANFWKTYHRFYNFLMNDFPNKAEVKSLQNLGPLERVHMEYIVQQEDSIMQLEKEISKINDVEIFVQPLYFGFGILQNSEEELQKIQDFALDLQTKTTDVLAIFPLGITIHWSLLIIYIHKNKLHCFYLDSKNVDLDLIIKGEFEQAVKDLKDGGSYIPNGKAKDPKDEGRQLIWMRDLRKSIEIIINTLQLKKTLEAYTVESNIRETTNDFNSYLKGQIEGSEGFITQMYKWFEEEYRPQIITNNLLKPLRKVKKIDAVHYNLLRRFENACGVSKLKLNADDQLKVKEDFDKRLLSDIWSFIDELRFALESVEVI